MKREFALEQIAHTYYNKLCEQYGIPADPVKRRKRRFKMLDSVAYAGVEQLLKEVSDDSQYLRVIWAPKISIPIGEARRRTQEDSENYFTEIRNEESKYEKIVIELLQHGVHHSRGFCSDKFQFNREGVLWMLRHFHIKRENFGLYTFEGLNDLDSSSTHAISGIYLGSQSQNKE